MLYACPVTMIVLPTCCACELSQAASKLDASRLPNTGSLLATHAYKTRRARLVARWPEQASKAKAAGSKPHGEAHTTLYSLKQLFPLNQTNRYRVTMGRCADGHVHMVPWFCFEEGARVVGCPFGTKNVGGLRDTTCTLHDQKAKRPCSIRVAPCFVPFSDAAARDW